MDDRVHPRDSPPTQPLSDKPIPPPPATYVIQLPKDQIYRIPPPENSRKYTHRQKPRRGCCCRCLCYTLSLLLLLLILTAITAGILYFILRPQSPKYTVENISVAGINLTSSSPINPHFTVKIRAQNPNKKLSIYYYEKGSSVNIDYESVNLSNGVLPTFYQPSRNVTVIETVLKGSSGIILGSEVKSAMVKEERENKVPLRLNLKAPVKIKVGSVKTWKITVKVKCDVVVDGLTVGAKIVSKTCDYSVKLW